ncbi:MAG: T9SS type A sorting domain-containing protein [Bacteroidetes bacterium]|nr:T9SS type A sorting domain-containing protein [Bacteroidota bacterium]
MKTIYFIFAFALYLGIDATIAFSQGAWTQKADFGGTERCYAVGFSIGTAGYIGTGTLDFGGGTTDFWEWRQSINTWTQKADVGGIPRYFASAFSIGTKGYIATGTDGNSDVGMTDLWEYNPLTNIWTQKAPFPGTPRYGCVSFSIDDKGYIGTGRCDPDFYKDFWEYDPDTDSWTQISDFGGDPRGHATAFSYSGKAYLGTGYFVNYDNGTVIYYKDFWEYNPATDVWLQKSDYPGGNKVLPAGFSLVKCGYMGSGQDTILNCTKDFWMYDMQTDTWSQIEDLTGQVREGAVGFSIGMKGYIGTGHTYTQSPYFNGFDKDFWEYDPSATGTADIPGKKVQVTVYPNPVSDMALFTVEGLQKNQTAELNLYDFSGKEVKHITFSCPQYVMNRKGLPSGIYIYKIYSKDKETDSGKIIIK